MRVLTCVAMGCAIVAATPALAQNNSEAPAANAAEANAPAPINAVSPTPGTPAPPSGQSAAEPPTSTAPADAGASPIIGQKSNFPWGVLGLLGLVGLFGRKRSS